MIATLKIYFFKTNNNWVIMRGDAANENSRGYYGKWFIFLQDFALELFL